MRGTRKTVTQGSRNFAWLVGEGTAWFWMRRSDGIWIPGFIRILEESQNDRDPDFLLRWDEEKDDFEEFDDYEDDDLDEIDDDLFDEDEDDIDDYDEDLEDDLDEDLDEELDDADEDAEDDDDF